MKNKNMGNARQEYNQGELYKQHVSSDPFVVFDKWLNEAMAQKKFEPTAMVLATVDAQGLPNTRVVLLKEIRERQFIFYSNYDSAKGQELADNPQAALNFYWPNLCRQIRIRGQVSKVPSKISDDYFASRPRQSQISAAVSEQSAVLESRDELEANVAEFQVNLGDAPCERPEHWGGYALAPQTFEYWLGRKNRLHDRLQYIWDDVIKQWQLQRLSP